MITRVLAVAAAVALLAAPLHAALVIPSTAIVVTPIGKGRIALGDDGKDHVEYDLLVTNVFDSPVTLSRLEVLDPGGKVLMTLEGAPLKAATQTLLRGQSLDAMPASGSAALEVDLMVAPGTAPAEVRNRLSYTVSEDAPAKAVVGTTTVDGPIVEIDRTPATAIISPVVGAGWSAGGGCCTPNLHRNIRIGAGTRIARAELFAIDWVRFDGNRIHSGDGKANSDYAFFGQPVRAVADGKIVNLRDGMEESLPNAPVTTVKTPEDYAGNYIIQEIKPGVYAFYAHFQPGSLKVRLGDQVTAGTVIGSLGNTGNSTAPHLHFGLIDRPDFLTAEGLPFVITRFTVTGRMVGGDFSKAEIAPENRTVENAYPLLDGIATYE